jgi:hypothetical protein
MNKLEENSKIKINDLTYEKRVWIVNTTGIDRNVFIYLCGEYEPSSLINWTDLESWLWLITPNLVTFD